MSQAISSPQGCCTPGCPDPQIVNIPGSPGAAAQNGQDGIDGVSAFSFTTASFVMPAELGTVTIAVTNSMWAAVGEPLFIPGAGFLQVTAIPSSASITLKNLKDTPNLAYMGNVAPGTVIAANAKVTPSGVQGVAFPSQVLNGNGPPGAPPPNAAKPATYWDKTNKAEWHWNDTLAIWE